MVTHTSYVIATLAAAAMCLTTAWPQQRVAQSYNRSTDSDRIVMESIDSAYLKTIFTYPNSQNTTETKSTQRRPLRLQSGFLLDQEYSRHRQTQRGGEDSTRRQRQHQSGQQASRRADSAEREGRMEGANNNQTRKGGSGRVNGTTAHEARGLSNVTSTRIKMPNESIVFPEANREQRRNFVPSLQGNRPACADNGDTFCTSPTGDYPVEHLSRILDQQGVVFRNFFTSDVVPEANDIAQRFDDSSLDEQPLCMSEAHVVYPKVAQNKDNEWMFIVNLNEDDYKQGVRVEKCRTPDEPCAYNEGFPSGRQTKCRQKYIYRQMLAISEDGTPKPDSFKLPSCCACHTSLSDAVARSGFDSTNLTPAPKRRRRRG